MKTRFLKALKFLAIILTFIVVMLQACNSYYFRSNYKETNSLLHETNNLKKKQFLKAHLKNGDVCIFKDTWQIDTTLNIVTGNGITYDFNRQKKYEGSLSTPIDSVAIFETNRKLVKPEEGRIAALCIMAGVDVILGIICITTPKACYGSCPTFYLNENDDVHYADAEGFSNAISPSLENFDIDALNNKIPTDSTFSIRMKNEALETHCVKDVKLLAYPRKSNERVYQSRTNDFYLCKNIYEINDASDDEGDITGLLRNDDRQERFSLADQNNLSSKEDIYLNFENVEYNNDLGLVVSFRQTLMTTYLMYSAIGYMGDEVGDIYATLENGKNSRKEFGGNLYKELGDIDVYVWNDNNKQWDFQGGWYETGPISFNHQILPIKNRVENHSVKVKLVMNKGLWRLDYFALTNIKEKVKPFEIPPDMVLKNDKADPNALLLIINPQKYLISMPGSVYKFNFTLPQRGTDYELFLYTRGYYLEWMREHWLKDKDLLALHQMFDNPKKYLKQEAFWYKKYETQMEQEFWNSKIDTKKSSYYEN